MIKNYFTPIMAKKSDAELEKVLASEKGAFEDDAILAAAQELSKRGLVTPETKLIISELSEKTIEKREVEEYNSNLVSKKIIYVLSALLTPIIVGPFMAYNIWTFGNKKGIRMVVVYTILYLPIIFIAFYILPVFLAGISHFIYIFLFIESTWDKYLPTFEEYKRIRDV